MFGMMIDFVQSFTMHQPQPCLGLNNIYFEKLSHTNLQTEQSGFGRKLQACKDHLPCLYLQVKVMDLDFLY